MNCLKCPIYWGDKVHECVCDECMGGKEFGEVYVALCHEMPPLITEEHNA